MNDILNLAANVLMNSVTEPIDWEAKRRADDQLTYPCYCTGPDPRSGLCGCQKRQQVIVSKASKPIQ
jgi:hypothetical protein